MFLPAETVPILAQSAPVFTAPKYQKTVIRVVLSSLWEIGSC